MPKPTTPIESLLADLHAPDFLTRCNAARQLGQTRDPRAVDALIPDLLDTDWRIRRNAAQALGAARDRRAVEPLIQTLQDRSVTVRQRAVVALGRIKDSRAIGPLLETLKTDNWHLYKDAFKAVQKFGAASIPAIAAALNDAGSDATQRTHLIDLLGATGHPDALEPLVAVLHDADPIVRLHAVCGLGVLSDRRAVEPLIGALADTSVQAQSMAVRALGQLGDIRVVGPLLQLLRDHELYGAYIDLYRAITLALQTLSGMPKRFGHSVRADFNLLSDEDALALKRTMINQIESLSNVIMLGGDKAAELLNLNRNLIQGIDEARSAVPQLVDTLITWLSADSALTRMAAAVSLPWYSDARALEPLRLAEHDPDPGVQTAAAWAAGTLEKLLIYRQQRR